MLPNSVTPLEAGKIYQWFITIVGDRYFKPNDPTFSGWIKRTEYTTEIKQQLANKNLQQQAEWYAKNGYWYDRLDSVPSDINLWNINCRTDR